MIPFLIEQNVLPKLIKLVEHTSITISIPCLRILGNILTGDEMQTQHAIDLGVLDVINRLICHPKKQVRKEVCWSVSNITAGTEQQVMAVFNIGIMQKFIGMALNDEPDISCEALWALGNATQNKVPQQISYLIQIGLFEVLIKTMKQADVKVVMVALEALKNILETGSIHFKDQEAKNQLAIQFEQEGGLDALERLQHHKNTRVYEIAIALLENYFQTEVRGMIGESLLLSEENSINNGNSLFEI